MQPHIFSERSPRKAQQGHPLSGWAMCFYNPVQARLRKDLKMQRQLGLSKQSPAFPCPLLYPCRSAQSAVPSRYPTSVLTSSSSIATRGLQPRSSRTGSLSTYSEEVSFRRAQNSQKRFKEPHAYPNKLSKSLCAPTQNQWISSPFLRLNARYFAEILTDQISFVPDNFLKRREGCSGEDSKSLYACLASLRTTESKA